MSNLLSVEELSLKDRSTGNEVLKDISFNLREKEILGVVGESGSGKTLLACQIALMNYSFFSLKKELFRK